MNRPRYDLKLYGRQRGDTIVEVLICVLIVSLVLAGAYVTTQRSSVGIRNSQEHSQVLKLIQSQVEQLRANSNQPNPAIFTATQPFCMVDGVPLSATNEPRCIQNSSGLPTTEQPAFRLSIRYTTNGTSGGTIFTINADWDSLTNDPARKTIFYRLHK